ncbi:MAG: helix-turn-helix transcriptional regulator [Planctomycetes bacterium]|nr:helix-turn-helix transcriptional regulator [Planctomycetota bacterium]
MNTRDRAKPPKPGLVWSERHAMWVEPEDRSAERRAKDEQILRNAEADQDRIRAAIKRAQETLDRHKDAVGAAAERVAVGILKSLIEARKRAGLSQVEVARRMDVPQSAVVRLESGRHSPTLMTIARYAAAIGVNLEVRQIA